MQILTGVRRILALVGLNGDKSMQENVRRRIHRAVVRSVLVIFLILWCTGCTLLTIQGVEQGIVAVLRPLLLGFAAGCGLVIYLCLLGKARQIDELFDWMDEIAKNCM